MYINQEYLNNTFNKRVFPKRSYKNTRKNFTKLSSLKNIGIMCVHIVSCVTLLFVTFFNRIKPLKEQNTIVLPIYIPFLRNLSQCSSPLHNNTRKWYNSKAIVAPSSLYLIKEQACTIILFFQCCDNF